MPDWGNVDSIRKWIREQEDKQDKEKQGPIQGPKTREEYEREMANLRAQGERAQGWRSPVRAYDRPDVQQAINQSGGRSAELLRLLAMTGESGRPGPGETETGRPGERESRRPGGGYSDVLRGAYAAPDAQTADVLRDRETEAIRKWRPPSSPYQPQIEAAGLRPGDTYPAWLRYQMERASGQTPAPDPNGGMMARPPGQSYAEFEAGRQADQAAMQQQALMLPASQRQAGWDVGNALSDAMGPAWTYYEDRSQQRADIVQQKIDQGVSDWYDPIWQVSANAMDLAWFVPQKRFATMPATVRAQTPEEEAALNQYIKENYTDTNLIDVLSGKKAAPGPGPQSTQEVLNVNQLFAPVGGALNKLLNPFNPKRFQADLPAEATPEQRFNAGRQMLVQANDYIWSEWQKHNALNQTLANLPDEQRREAELSLLNATSGADYAWQTFNQIQAKQNVETLRQTAKQLAAQGDTTTASQMIQTYRDTKAKSYADIVDENQNVWAELIAGVFADPTSVVLDPIIDAGMSAWRYGRAANKLKMAEQASTKALDQAVQDGIRLAGNLEQGITVPTAKNWIQQLFGRTAETKAHMEADALWKSMTQLFRGVDNADDARLLLQTWIENPSQLVQGVTGLTSKALRDVAGVADNKVRYGYLTVAGNEQLQALPVLQAIKKNLLDLPALNAQGGFNALEFLTQADDAIYKGVRRKYGLEALEDLGEGVTRWGIRRLDTPGANGERWVIDFLNKEGGVVRTSDAMSYDAAKKQTTALQSALTAGAKTPTVQAGLKMIGNVQRGFLSDMWLNLRPSHWIRNAAAATAATMADDLYTLRSVSGILDDLGAKFVGASATRRLQETLVGAGGKMMGQAGQTATDEGRHWSRAIWDKNNPYAALNEAASQVWSGMTHLFGTDIPFGEQAFYLRAYDKGFNRSFGKLWTDTVQRTLGPQIEQLGIDPNLGRSILDSVISAGVNGSKQDVAQVARKAVYGNFAPFDPRSLGIPDELLSADAWKMVQNGVEEWLASSPTPETNMQEIVAWVGQIMTEEKLRYGNILANTPPQPGVYEWSKLDAVDEAAEMMDELTSAAKGAGVDPQQAQQQAQDLASKLIDGQQQALDTFLQEVATANNPTAMNVAFDLLTTLHGLKTQTRRQVDALGRIAADVGTPEMWLEKWQKTGALYTQLSDDLAATITAAADDLRTVVAGGEVPRKYDWWAALRRYFDYDIQKTAELRATPLGSTKENRDLWESAIDANRQYLDASMVQLYDAFQRFPSVDALDVLRQTQKQIDIEGARVAAWLAGLRDKALQGGLKWDDYFAARNSAWYRGFDNMVLFNEAAKRAIVAQGLADQAPTQLRWVDDFAGGEFFLLGPADKDGYWLARRVDDGTIHKFDTPGRDPRQASPLVPQEVLNDWYTVTDQSNRIKPILEEIAQANPLPERPATGVLTPKTVTVQPDEAGQIPFDNYTPWLTDEQLAQRMDPSNDVYFQHSRDNQGPPGVRSTEPDMPTGGAGPEQGTPPGARPTPPGAAPTPEPQGPQPGGTGGAAGELDPNARLTKPANWQSPQRTEPLQAGDQVRHKKTGEIFTVEKRSDSGGWYYVVGADGKTKRYKSNSIEAVSGPPNAWMKPEQRARVDELAAKGKKALVAEYGEQLRAMGYTDAQLKRFSPEELGNAIRQTSQAPKPAVEASWLKFQGQEQRFGAESAREQMRLAWDKDVAAVLGEDMDLERLVRRFNKDGRIELVSRDSKLQSVDTMFDGLYGKTVGGKPINDLNDVEQFLQKYVDYGAQYTENKAAISEALQFKGMGVTEIIADTYDEMKQFGMSDADIRELATQSRRQVLEWIAQMRGKTPDMDSPFAGMITYESTIPSPAMAGGPAFLTDDPQQTLENVYQLMRSFWGKSKQPEVGDVAVHMIQTLDDAAERIIAALPELARRTPNTLDAGQKRFLLAAIDQLLPAFDNAVAESSRIGEALANGAMLNYQDRRGFDSLLSLVFPYHYFWSRGGATWARRLMTQPRTLNLVYETDRAIRNEGQQSDLPQRLGGSIPLIANIAGGQVRAGNIMNWLLPKPINDFVDPEAANNDLERMILRFQQVTPGFMPAIQFAMDSYLDAVAPLPNGQKRVQESVRNWVPMWGVAGDLAQTITGERLPHSGDPYDPYRTRRALSMMAQEGAFDGETAQYAQQISVNLENGRDRYDQIPQQAQKAADQAYLAAQKRAGGERLLSSVTGLAAGAPLYYYPDAEQEMRQAQKDYGQAGYNPLTNPYGSAAQRREVLDQNPGLPVYWSRNTGGPLEPAQAAQRSEMWGLLDSQVYGPMADAVTRAIIANPDITESELNKIKGPYYDKVTEIKARYPGLPESDPKPPSGANPTERAIYELERLFNVAGKPEYPGDGASPETLQQYYAAKAAWEEQRLNVIDQRLNQFVQQAEADPTSEWQQELVRLVRGRYSSDLLRQYKDLKYATDTERAWAEKEALRQEQSAANWKSKGTAVEERMGPEGRTLWEQYNALPKGGPERDALKAENPAVKEVIMAGFNPTEYDQAITLFGPDAWQNYYDAGRPQYPEGADDAGMQQYYDALQQWNQTHPRDAEMRFWLNGRATWGEKQSSRDSWYDFGKDWKEAQQIFGPDIFDVERSANSAADFGAWRNANPDAYMRYTGYREWKKAAGLLPDGADWLAPVDLGVTPQQMNVPASMAPTAGDMPRPLGSDRRPIGASDWQQGVTDVQPVPVGGPSALAQTGPGLTAEIPQSMQPQTAPAGIDPIPAGATGPMPTTAEGWAMRNASFAKGVAWQERKQEVYQVFGVETGGLYDQYLSLPSGSQARRDFKAQHPELRAVQLFTFQPEAYSQAQTIFGQDGIMAWAKTPAYQDTPEAKAARSDYLDKNPKAFTVGAWLYGRPGQDNEDTTTDEQFQYNLGADYATAKEMFGNNIWTVVEGYKRGWPKQIKSQYYKDNPNLSPFFDWWYGNLPKSTGAVATSRAGYSYGGGGGGGWGGGGGRGWTPTIYPPRIDQRYMDRELEVTAQMLRRWRPNYDGLDLSWLRAGDRIGPEQIRAWRAPRTG